MPVITLNRAAVFVTCGRRLSSGLATYLSTVNSSHTCWCGQTELADFSPDYLRCPKCQTLVLRNWPSAERFDVVDDASDFYGRNYYEKHLSEDYGLPSLEERARNDLNERCMHWMRAVLKYRLPPAHTLELGCAHGGFVALMRWAGFDATGLELSPWLANYAKSAFGVPILTGRIEDQQLEPRSLDVILLFDVLEHLPDPLSTMSRCVELLKPDGTLVIQTPCFPAGRTHQQMVETHDRFLEHFKPAEHLYLFSEASIQRLFSDIGTPFVRFEPAIFYEYDMFVFASPREFVQHSTEEGAEALLRHPEGRIIQALLDANTQYQAAGARIAVIEADREARLQKLLEMDALYKQVHADLLKMEASYKLQMSYGLARLLRRLQAPLKMDALFKAMEERLASGSKADGASAVD